jgi:hypothetical protein
VKGLQDLTVGGVRPFLVLFSPWCVQVFLWAQVLAGWVLATLFVVGLTGIVRAE